MNHGSLFSGIGGFDLAAEWMGWDNKFHCEWEDFPKQILKHYWPNAKSYGDIKQTDFTIWNGKIDILTGGFPCQPYSSAGKRLGKEDERHLWPEMLRAIRQIKPRWVVGENVFGLITWNDGMVFEEVQADLEAEGYEVQPYILPAASTNAPHKRNRVWFVAYCGSERCGRWDITSKANKNEEQQMGASIRQYGYGVRCETKGCSTDASNTSSKGLQRTASKRIQESKGGRNKYENGKPSRFSRCDWERFPTQSPICSGNDGLPNRFDGITFPKWRKESIKGYGNAVVPQVVYQIFKAIEQYEVRGL